MAKKKASKKSESTKAAKRSDGAKEIKQAEARLAKAIAAVEEARSKVTRRERDLADVLARHGHPPPAVVVTESVIALDAPASDPAANGSAQVEPEAETGDSEAEAVDQHE
jgi:hypothetical protein